MYRADTPTETPSPSSPPQSIRIARRENVHLLQAVLTEAERAGNGHAGALLGLAPVAIPALAEPDSKAASPSSSSSSSPPSLQIIRLPDGLDRLPASGGNLDDQAEPPSVNELSECASAWRFQDVCCKSAEIDIFSLASFATLAQMLLSHTQGHAVRPLSSLFALRSSLLAPSPLHALTRCSPFPPLHYVIAAARIVRIEKQASSFVVVRNANTGSGDPPSPSTSSGYTLVLEGLTRIRIDRWTSVGRPYFEAQVSLFPRSGGECPSFCL